MLLDYNGKLIPGTRRTFRLNWGMYGGGSKSETHEAVAKESKTEGDGPDYSIYIGDLDRNVSDVELLAVFSKRYQHVHSARIICEPGTGVSKGYGFVKFTNEAESNKAIMQMKGHVIRGKAIKTA